MTQLTKNAFQHENYFVPPSVLRDVVTKNCQLFNCKISSFSLQILKNTLNTRAYQSLHFLYTDLDPEVNEL